MNNDVLTVVFSFIDGYSKIRMTQTCKMFKNILDCYHDKISIEKIFKNFAMHEIKKHGQDLFIESISKNNIIAAKWLYSLNIIDIHCDSDYALYRACMYGRLDMAKWLYGIGANYRINLFWQTCFLRHWDISKWLCDLNIMDLEEAYEGFHTVCQTGDINMAKWIYCKYSKINVHFDEDACFRVACIEGHIEMAQWLHSLGNINIHACTDHAFRMACYYGHINVATWLYSLGGICVKEINEYALPNACRNKHYNVVGWLLLLGCIQPTAKVCESLENCAHENINLVAWIKTVNIDNVSNKLLYHAFEHVYTTGKFDDAIWLYNTNKILPLQATKNKIISLLEKSENHIFSQQFE